MNNNWTRKEFLKLSLLGGGAALVASRGRLAAQTGGAPAIAAPGSANGDVRVACVGIHSQGASHMRDYASGKIKGARLVALCDADSAVLAQRVADCDKLGVKVTAYADFRKLLDDPNIDAVVFAPPNHWHSLMTIWALQAGKHVYVEKPLSHNIWEGRQAVEASRKYRNLIVQAGTQNRSSHDIPQAIEYVRAGKLGKIQWARGLCYKPRESIGKTSGPQPVPASIDYNLWTGPADLVPPHRNDPRYGTVHYDWHWFWNYGGGDMSNQGIHQMDVARWFLGEPELPPSVIAFGGRFGYDDDAETPNTEVSVFNYAKAPLIFEVRGLPAKAGMRAMDNYRHTRVGVVVQCEGGYVEVSEAGTVGIYDNDNKVLQRLTNQGLGEHRQNFIDAVRAGKPEMARGNVENSHISTCLCHLGNLSYRVGHEQTNAELAEAIRESAPTKEAFGRVLEHLKANQVDVEKTRTVLGPLLTVDARRELITGPDRTIADAANSNPLRKRVGRAPFTVPDLQGKTVQAAVSRV
jgi:predicted dehydrogenase